MNQEVIENLESIADGYLDVIVTMNYNKNPYTYNAEYTDASTGNQQSVPESEIV